MINKLIREGTFLKKMLWWYKLRTNFEILSVWNYWKGVCNVKGVSIWVHWFENNIVIAGYSEDEKW